MIPTLRDQYCTIFHGIHQTMGIVDAARPETG